MMQSFRAVAPWLGVLVFALVAVPASSQVPQDTTFTGRLVDDLGNPLVGPVTLELRILATETGGVPTSNCCTDNGPGNPGCDNSTCQSDVCAADAFCCATAWDQACASGALALCGDLCVYATLYREEHLGVALDATGGFSVQLGLGTVISGTFDADLFSGRPERSVGVGLGSSGRPAWRGA